MSVGERIVAIVGCGFCCVQCAVTAAVLLVTWLRHSCSCCLLYLQAQICVSTMFIVSLSLYQMLLLQQHPKQEESWPYILYGIHFFVFVSLSSHMNILLVMFIDIGPLNRIPNINIFTIAFFTVPPILLSVMYCSMTLKNFKATPTSGSNGLEKNDEDEAKDAQRNVDEQLSPSSSSYFVCSGVCNVASAPTPTTGALNLDVVVIASGAFVVGAILLFLLLFVCLNEKLQSLCRLDEESNRRTNILRRFSFLYQSAVVFVVTIAMAISSMVYLHGPSSSICRALFSTISVFMGFTVAFFYLPGGGRQSLICLKVVTMTRRTPIQSDAVSSALNSLRKGDRGDITAAVKGNDDDAKGTISVVLVDGVDVQPTSVNCRCGSEKGGSGGDDNDGACRPQNAINFDCQEAAAAVDGRKTKSVTFAFTHKINVFEMDREVSTLMEVDNDHSEPHQCNTDTAVASTTSSTIAVQCEFSSAQGHRQQEQQQQTIRLLLSGEDLVAPIVPATKAVCTAQVETKAEMSEAIVNTLHERQHGPDDYSQSAKGKVPHQATISTSRTPSGPIKTQSVVVECHPNGDEQKAPAPLPPQNYKDDDDDVVIMRRISHDLDYLLNGD